MNSIVFIDSFAWIALINKADNYHKKCWDIFDEIIENQIKIITTNLIIVETINALSKSIFKKLTIEFMNRLFNSPDIEIVKITDNIFWNAWKLYQDRLDKNWGITDCTSFEVMKQFNIHDSFTNDRHFEQAGFNILLKQSKFIK